MGEYDGTILRSHVNTALGATFLLVWMAGAGLMVWHAAFDTDPVQHLFVKTLYDETYLQ